MNNYRQAEGGRDVELSPKCAFLFHETWSRSRKIEAGFSDGNRVENLDRLLQLSSERALVAVCQLRVQTESKIDIKVAFPQQS
jgi:hypothetical protein